MADKFKPSSEGRQLHRPVKPRDVKLDRATSASFEESTRVDEMPTRNRKASAKLEKANEERREEFAGEENKQT